MWRGRRCPLCTLRRRTCRTAPSGCYRSCTASPRSRSSSLPATPSTSPSNALHLALHLADIISNGLSLSRHREKLARLFEVQRLHIPVNDATRNEDLIGLIERMIREERKGRPIYLLGEGYGALLAISVAARNPDADLVLVLVDPVPGRCSGILELKKEVPVDKVFKAEIYGLLNEADCSHGNTDDQNSPKLVTGIDNQKVTQVTCGWGHTVAITDTGNVYSWGRGTSGQLGHGEAVDRCIPKRVELLSADGLACQNIERSPSKESKPRHHCEGYRGPPLPRLEKSQHFMRVLRDVLQVMAVNFV